LSDGCWDFRELEDFLEKTREIRPALSALAIGADADWDLLERMAGQGNVFRVEDVLAAMESCLEAFNVE